MAREVTCLHCEFTFVFVPIQDEDKVVCPRCSHQVAVSPVLSGNRIAGQEIRTRELFQYWGKFLGLLALPLIFCCVAPTCLGDVLVGVSSKGPLPHFSTVMICGGVLML